MSIQNTSAAARRNDGVHSEEQDTAKKPQSGKAAQAAAPEARKSAPTDTHAELDAAEKELNAYSKKYDQKADGKAGVQKAMDWVRKGFNEGYGDDQFKNIGKTREALSTLRQDLDGNKISQAEARDKLATIRDSFNSEEKRVTEAQGENAKIGQAVHGAGRAGVVTLSGLGATAASGGNVFVGFAAASGAASLYDAATVADQGKSEIAPKLDSGNSLGGVAAQGLLKGEKIDGAFSGQGMLSAKAAQVSAQQVAAQSGSQASRMALGNAAAQANVLNTAAQTGTTYGMKTLGTAVDTSLTQQQKQDQIGQNSLQTIKQLPGQLAFGALSSHLGVSAQVSNKVVDKGVQAGMDGLTNLAQTSVGNALDGKGLGLSKADLAAAAVNTGTGTVQNLAQRVPQRTAQDVTNDIGTMHPYTGTPRSAVPERKDGSTVVVGRLQGLQYEGSTERVVPVHTAQSMRSTPELWQGNGRAAIDMAAAHTEGPAHVYRTFDHPLTKERMVLAVDLDKSPVAGQRDQAAMDRLRQQAGLSSPLPVKPLIDETPSNVLPQTRDDVHALTLMKGASTLAQGVGLVGGNPPEPLQRFDPGTPVMPRNEVKNYGVPAEWLRHFLEGSGTPKTMSETQVETALKRTGASDRHDIRSALQPQIEELLRQGTTEGKVEGATKDIPMPMSAADGWYNALGSAHVSAVYKGDWKVDGSDGSVRFQGEQRWLVQDRYNWESAEFNGSSGTKTAPGIPAALVRLMPPSYQEAFGSGGSQGRPGMIEDAMFGHFQMLQGGAQPFWTFGLSAPTAVDLHWTPGANSRSTE
jgi:hypothetical protein